MGPDAPVVWIDKARSAGLLVRAQKGAICFTVCGARVQNVDLDGRGRGARRSRSTRGAPGPRAGGGWLPLVPRWGGGGPPHVAPLSAAEGGE